ncbi:MAG: leucine-rich repeat protein, partial [Muribaculaceae bacterium]|nr:leucine-rich repeat protein [Muribaculaceae bacterium]
CRCFLQKTLGDEQEDWERVLVAEIDADRPVLYSGQDVSAGHAFVCDGYEKRGASTYFHINWGWGGLANSYFASDALNPQASHNYQFNDQTTIVYNIKPAEASAEWSPIHLTSDERQIGITTGVADLTPGMEFTVRAGNFKNIMFETFSGSVAVALFDAAGGFKTLLSAPQGLTLGSLNLLPRGYADFACVVPADAVVSDGDNVRMVTRAGAEGAWLPVAGDMLTRAQVPAKGNDVPYCTISMPAAVDGAEISADGNRVVTGRDYTFTVSAASADKVVTVKANGFILTPGAGNVYRLQNVLADQEIQIFAQNAADVVSKRSLWVSAGTLSSLVSDEDAGTIKELTLYGTVDVNDFTFMRERMKLEALDLSAVTVVANGANPANAIPAKAFRNCWAMKRLVLPRNITTLKNGCFELAGLRSIEIPASVSTYEYNLFLNCSDLTEVVVRRKSPAWVNWCVFAGTPKARLVVPVGSKNAYASKENWQDFREIVEEDAAPVTSCTVALQDAAGVKITPLAEGIEFAPGTPISFTVETDDTFGDATMEVYANSTRLSADASGVYTVTVNENTFIHTRFNQPQPTLYDSPWRITSSQGGVGMCTDVVNVVAGKNFSIRVNALAIPADNALMYYAAVLTDAKGAIKEFISPVISNSGSNYGDLPCTFNCVVKEASVREGNLVRVATSYNKKNWALVKGADGSVADSIAALGNRVVYHSVTMPDEIAGATIEGAATQVVRGMPFSCKVTAVEYSDVVAVFVNGKLVGSDKNVINVRIGAVTEDLDIAVQVNQKGAESYLVLNVQEGELDAKLSENCPARLKLVGTIHTSEFAALQKHASTIQALDLADLKIKGNGDLADAIPSQAFAPAGMTLPALKSVVLPTSLRNIEANAFYRCTGITEITIPSSVGYIGNGALSSCVNLKKIVAQGTVPPRLGNMTPFPANAANITLEVPKGAENAYKAAEYWNALGLTTAKVYYNIQVDPTRCCQYNSSRPLDKIDVDQITSVDIMLPTFKWGLYHKENPVYRPGIAFKLYDNGVDKTSTMEALDWSDPFCNGGHYLVRFGSAPVNHRLDIEFYYAINLNSPEGAALSFVGLDEANVWKDVPMALFVENSTATPTLYKEGTDYRFRVECSNAAMQPKVRIRNRVMSKYGATQEFTETEAIALPDENGVYTIENLRGDATVTVTMVPSDGAVLNGSEIAAVDAEDAADMTVLGVSGVLSDNDYAAIRENFTSVETLDLSEMENAEIPDGAFENMENLSSVVVPDNV